jgi:hypothetical protein
MGNTLLLNTLKGAMTHIHQFGTPEVKPRPWVGIFVQDLKTGLYRVFSKEITQPMIDSCAPDFMGLDTGEHMIRTKYMQKQFDNMDRWHYINWCVSYVNHTSFEEQQKRNLIVAVQISDTEPEVNKFLQHWLDQINSKMDLTKVTYGHK